MLGYVIIEFRSIAQLIVCVVCFHLIAGNGDKGRRPEHYDKVCRPDVNAEHASIHAKKPIYITSLLFSVFN